MSKAEDEPTRTLAAGWRVFKATDLDAKANAIYIHLLDPAIAETDYRPSLWLDKLLDGAPPELLSKYRDAFAAASDEAPAGGVGEDVGRARPQAGEHVA